MAKKKENVEQVKKPVKKGKIHGDPIAEIDF